MAARIERQTRRYAAPTVKQQLAAIRHLFDWLVTGQIVPGNPASSVRGPRHSVKKGKTPVLEPAEARGLLDAIDTATHAGLRDRALIGLMVYTFARIRAALAMRVEDVYSERQRLWVRLREKGGKRHEMPCHHNLEAYLTSMGPESVTTPKGRCSAPSGARPGGSPALPFPKPMPTPWCAGAPAPLASRPRSGITASAPPASPPVSRTVARWRRPPPWSTTPAPAATQLYDRRSDEVTLDEVERVGI